MNDLLDALLAYIGARSDYETKAASIDHERAYYLQNASDSLRRLERQFLDQLDARITAIVIEQRGDVAAKREP